MITCCSAGVKDGNASGVATITKEVATITKEVVTITKEDGFR